MSQNVVGLIDYGLGNLFSVELALRHIGAEVEIVDKPERVLSFDRIILPGVGSFGDGMKGLRARGLIEPIKEYAESGRSLLGVCLGMQLLMTEGEEFGSHDGLNLISGRVVSLRGIENCDRQYKVPHIGWNRLNLSVDGIRSWDNTILAGLREGAFMYFAHSYAVMLSNASDCIAETEYNVRFCSVARKENIYGCQFHPERSGIAGLEIYRQFIFGSR